MGRSIHHPTGIIHNSPSAEKGYTLFSSQGGKHATLIDMDGQVVHRWNHDEGIVYATLLENGNLLCRTLPPDDCDVVNGIGGSSRSLVGLNWDNEIVWEYRDPMIHHDFVRLENGNTVVLAFEQLGDKWASKIRGGYTPDPEEYEGILGDVLREVTPEGEILKDISISELLDLDKDVICPLETRREWTHGNSINLTAEGNFLVSFRLTHTVGIVDASGEKFLWKWGPGEVHHQHNPTYLKNGNILIFDNGSHSKGMDHSRVIDVNPSTDEVEWEYSENPPLAFYSFHISSAERQPNGNTLICEGAFGRIFEVTNSGDVVWEYVNQFYAPDARTGNLTNMSFRAHKYLPDYKGLKNKDLDPGKYSNINRLNSQGQTNIGLITS